MSIILDGTTGVPVTTVTGTLPVANGGTGVATSTGTGAVVLGTSPTLTTPAFDSATFATVSGTAPLYGCRAWVNFDGTTATPCTIRGSGNVTSVNRNATGDYTINFTTAMPDANYSYVLNGGFTGGLTLYKQKDATAMTTTTFPLVAVDTLGNTMNVAHISVAIFR
jgi:hypothetical protein